ncbi:MAG: hypothetical protein IPJ07_20500 [Acidobacteria bacterium]|nr:hypothetical protein [Acidobacteriota bacterium]
MPCRTSTRNISRDDPDRNDFVEHPNYDDFWEAGHGEAYLTRVNIPTLSVAGWWDQGDFYRPPRFTTRSKSTTNSACIFLVAAPWNHGGLGER